MLPRGSTGAHEAAAADGDELPQARLDLALAYVDQHLGHDLRAWRRAERVVSVFANSGDRQTLVRAQACLGRSKLAAHRTELMRGEPRERLYYS